MNHSAIDDYIETHTDESLVELGVLCAQPSVGAQKWGLEDCAALVKEMLEKRGFDVSILPTGGAPVVFAERRGRSSKTLLFYNHYDVQPPEPLEEWVSPPFEPAIRDGKMYARGVSDDKGHITNRLFALDALLAQDANLPCTVKFIIEGEEETSSEHLYDFVRTHQDLLAADACIWEFGAVDHTDRPVQHLGMRGILYVELGVKTANQDVHSGLGGSIFPNPAWRLAWALNSLKSPDEKIRIPGFYDDVLPPSEYDRTLMASLPDPAGEYKQRYGIKGFVKGLEGGLELKIAEVFDPTCTICGLTSGYQGPGSKTVLPATASAKVDFRLVPNQDPKRILELLRAHLDREGFSDVTITDLGSDMPSRTDPRHPFVLLAAETARKVYGQPMLVVPMTGGSGPSYPFSHDLGLPIARIGHGYPGTQMHAPNENIRIDLYQKCARHTARLVAAFAEAA